MLGPGGHMPLRPNLAVLLTHCGQLILRKISKFGATRYQSLRHRNFQCKEEGPLLCFLTMEMNERGYKIKGPHRNALRCYSNGDL